MSRKADLSVMQRALSLFSSDDHGYYLSGPFFDIDITLFQEHPGARSVIGAITEDLWNISTLVERLEWSRQQCTENEHLKSRWFYYAKVDIEHFHTEVRSILDYAAELIAVVSNAGQLPTSFRRLLERKAKYEAKIAPDILALLGEVEWFWDVRTIRDNLVHHGALAIVFGDPETGILFQVFEPGFKRLVNKPSLLYNANVVHFERYAALYFSWLITFLDSLAATFVPGEKGAIRSRCYSPGFKVLHDWIADYTLHLQAEADDAS